MFLLMIRPGSLAEIHSHKILGNCTRFALLQLLNLIERKRRNPSLSVLDYWDHCQSPAEVSTHSDVDELYGLSISEIETFQPE